MNDPAFYLAQRARELYAVSPRATMRELLRVCRLRGIDVIRAPELDRPGWFVKQGSLEVIYLRSWTPWVLAHEIAHSWLSEHIEYGIAYAFSDYAEDDVERQAERFACLLCGTFAERAQALFEFER